MQSMRVNQAFPCGEGKVVDCSMAAGLSGIVRKRSIVRIIASSKRFVKFSDSDTACANDGTEGVMLVANQEYFFENDGYNFINFSVAIVVANDSVVEIINKSGK